MMAAQINLLSGSSISDGERGVSWVSSGWSDSCLSLTHTQWGSVADLDDCGRLRSGIDDFKSVSVALSIEDEP